MEAISEVFFDYISVRTFWRVLQFAHYTMAVALLGLVTLQSVAVLMPVQQAAGNFISRVRAAPAAAYVKPIVILYVPTFLLGAWIYIKYRTYVRIPMEQFGHWWTVGTFEFKEHIVAMGVALLPAYWYFWRTPAPEHARTRLILTTLLAFIVWWGFIVGHLTNNIRGLAT